MNAVLFSFGCKDHHHMSADEMFRGFKVAVGKDRFDEPIEISGEPVACKVSAQEQST